MVQKKAATKARGKKPAVKQEVKEEPVDNVSTGKRKTGGSQPSSPSKRAAATKNEKPVALDPNRVVRVYADGIFDLTHFGHFRMLEQCKHIFPNTYLLVGCCNDETTHKLKGKTVFTDVERYESLRHCKWVDEVIPDAPWEITVDFLDKHKIDFVAHDDAPYTQGTSGNDVYAPIKAMGRFVATQRTEGISTSDLINRILIDYDQYILRNLSRGMSAKDMHVGFLKEQELALKNKFGEAKTKVNKWKGETTTAINKAWKAPVEKIHDFKASPGYQKIRGQASHLLEETTGLDLDHWKVASSAARRKFLGLFSRKNITEPMATTSDIPPVSIPEPPTTIPAATSVVAASKAKGKGKGKAPPATGGIAKAKAKGKGRARR